MTDEQRQYFELMESLFAHPGWTFLVNDTKEMQAAISASWRTLKPETLGFEQGRHAGLDQISNFQIMVENGKASATEPPLLEDE